MAQDLIRRNSAATAARRDDSVAPARVLIVADNPANPALGAAILSAAGHCAKIVHDSRRALEAVRGGGYDMVLMDVGADGGASGLDGLATARAIRAMGGPMARIPIVAMTGDDGGADEPARLAAGIDDVMFKPFARADLLSKVARWRLHSPKQAWRVDFGAADPLIDHGVLDQLAADTSPLIVPNLVLTYLAETRARVTRIERAAETGDAQTMEREAHALKSSSGSYGAAALQTAARALETACRDDGARTVELIEEIHLLAIRSMAALRAVYAIN